MRNRVHHSRARSVRGDRYPAPHLRGGHGAFVGSAIADCAPGSGFTSTTKRKDLSANGPFEAFSLEGRNFTSAI